MTQSHEAFSMMPSEYDHLTYETECIAPRGLGFGEGSISAREILTEKQLAQVQEILITHKTEIIRPVEEDDDGCGDGRPTDRIFRVIDNKTNEVREYEKSKLRAKIFGGGLQVAASMWRAVAGAPERGETVLGDRKYIAEKLKEKNVLYGAHTDTHAQGDACGCGAIDKYPTSVALSGTYRQEIVDTAPALDNEVSLDNLENVLDTRKKLAANEHYMSDAAGRLTMDYIQSEGAVVKRLCHEHREAFVFANDEAGTTVDQTVIAHLFKEAGLPDDVHVFVIDVWRGRMYADIVSRIAEAEIGANKDQAEKTAFADFLVNQLSVAATLTAGDIPVIYNKRIAS